MPPHDYSSQLAAVEQAVADKLLTESAAANIRAWLSEPRYAEYAPQVAEHIAQTKWQELDNVFWTVIPFGTGGRRGRMYPIGSNAINDRTIGESAQGLADYVRETVGGDALSCAIAYDTRHRSRDFAELCAEVMVAAGFRVFFLDGYRSTPELSFAVRHKKCSCGIMVTASHNPPSDNAVKVYWSTGGQLLPPHDSNVIERVMSTEEIERKPFAEALDSGAVVYCQEEVDMAFINAVFNQSTPGPRDIKIIYSPLHGVGASAICPALAADGFTDVEVFGPHETPDGDFPNVPGHVSNPENPAVFDTIVARAKETGADLVLASDPDADRIGLSAPLTFDDGAEWRTMTGNQIGALLTDYVLDSNRAMLSPEHYVVKTLVTTEMIRRIADGYGVRTCGNLLVGFKWIGGTMDEQGPEKFLFGAEESHGYLTGTYARDKDAAVAAMLVAELAAKLKDEGKTLHEKLDDLFWQFGCHAEKMVSVTLPGAEGMDQMQVLMAGLRDDPPREIAGIPVTRGRDFLNQTSRRPGEEPQPLDCPQGDMVMLDVEPAGTYVAIRPSGTEPKVKFYMFTYEPAEQIALLDDTKDELAARLDKLAEGLSSLAKG